MLLVVLIILLSLLLLYYKSVHNLFHPVVLILASWSLIIILYLLLPHHFYSLGSRFSSCIILWVTSFILGTKLIGSTPNRIKENKIANCHVVKIYWILACLSTLLVAYDSIKIASNSDFFFLMLRSMNTGLDDNIQRDGSEILGYLANILCVLYIYELMRPQEEYSKTRVGVLLGLSFLAAFVTMAKTNFFMILFSSLFIMHEKGVIKTKQILLSAVLFIIFCIGLQTIRSFSQETVNPLEFLSSYLLSGSVAFDKMVVPEYYVDGRHVFRLLYAIAGAFNNTINVEPTIYEYQTVSLEGDMTNVYTCMYPFYVDYGFIGVIIGGIFIGAFSMFFFSRRKNSDPCMICYSIFSTFLVLGFLGDFIVTNASNSIQYIFYAFFPYLIKRK